MTALIKLLFLYAHSTAGISILNPTATRQVTEQHSTAQRNLAQSGVASAQRSISTASCSAACTAITAQHSRTQHSAIQHQHNAASAQSIVVAAQHSMAQRA